MLAESACVPVPSEVIMMFGGALAAGAAAGAHPSLAGVFAAGVLGNVAGSYASWAVGKYAGQAAISRWGRRRGGAPGRRGGGGGGGPGGKENKRAPPWCAPRGRAGVLAGRVPRVPR